MSSSRILVVLYENPLIPRIRWDEFYNTGNNVFINAISSYFYSKDIQSTFIIQKDLLHILNQNKHWVNNNFDKVIISEANFIGERGIDQIDLNIQLASLINKPIFILGAGAQSTIDYSTAFVSKISDKLKKLADLIYSQGGGAISVRGEFTKEVFSKIGFSDVVVTGCPSLYYNGPDFSVNTIKVERKDFLPVFNGEPRLLSKYLESHPYAGSVFYDQDRFYHIIYGSKDTVLIDHIEAFAYMPSFNDSLMRQNRIREFLNYKQWADDIRQINPSFAYGTKIHGTIISLLNGVPAFIDVIDSRTRELSDFFKIPNSYTTPFDYEAGDLFELSQSIDWSEFNENYKIKYNNFKDFLSTHGLENVLGRNEEYKSQQETLVFNYPTQDVINANLDRFANHIKRWEYLSKHKVQKSLLRIIRGAIPNRELRHTFMPYLCIHKK